MCVWGGESRRTGPGCMRRSWTCRSPQTPIWPAPPHDRVQPNGFHQVIITWHSRALLSLRQRWIISNIQVLSIQKRKRQKNTNRRRMFRAGVHQEFWRWCREWSAFREGQPLGRSSTWGEPVHREGKSIRWMRVRSTGNSHEKELITL